MAQSETDTGRVTVVPVHSKGTHMANTKSRTFLGVVMVMGVLGWCDAAVAQERLELVTAIGDQLRVVELDATVRGFGEVRRATPLSNAADAAVALFSGVPVAGGRYLVAVQAYPLQSLVVFDRRTRALSQLTDRLPTVNGGPLFDQRIVAVDSHRPRVFVEGIVGSPRGAVPQLFMVDLRGGAPVLLGAPTWRVRGAAYAANVDQLFTIEADLDADPRTVRVVVTNATTGERVRQFYLPGYVPAVEQAIRVDADGRMVWVDHGGLLAIDALSGTVVARTTDFAASLTTVDAERGLLLARQGDFLVAVDPIRLTEIGRARVAFTPEEPNYIRDAHTVAGRLMTAAYTIREATRLTLVRLGRTGREDIFERVCETFEVDALSADGTRRATVDLLTALGPGTLVGARGPACWAAAFLFKSPSAPTGLAATVSAGQVTLTWRDPGDTTEFELEYGRAAGQRLGAIRTSGTTGLTVPSVPPGVYFVRVKAINEVGSSQASNEVRVVVP